MDPMTSWILGHTPGDFISPMLLERLAGDSFKPMDRDIARENLILFKRATDKCHTDFFLFFGTLLGAVRENNFIEYDYDTDLGIMEEARPRLAEAAPLLIQAGFEFVRCKDHGRFLTFMRKGEFIDVYVAKRDTRFFYRHCWNLDGSLFPLDLLTEFVDMEFLGEPFLVPRRYEELFIVMYGTDWRVAKKNCPAHVPFDIFHPYRSTLMLVRKYLSKKTTRRLKRLIRKS